MHNSKHTQYDTTIVKRWARTLLYTIIIVKVTVARNILYNIIFYGILYLLKKHIRFSPSVSFIREVPRLLLTSSKKYLKTNFKNTIPLLFLLLLNRMYLFSTIGAIPVVRGIRIVRKQLFVELKTELSYTSILSVPKITNIMVISRHLKAI